jgi:hypothetical protein
MLVADLDGDLSGITAREPVPSDLGSRLGGLALGLVEVINRLATGKMNWLSRSGLPQGVYLLRSRFSRERAAVFVR